MADKGRFVLFARYIVERFLAPRIYDVAGGQGQLNLELTHLGRSVTTFDERHKHADVHYARQRFTVEVPCECDLVVGMHPDGATRAIIEYAAAYRIPFAVVPCCSDNGMAYRPWMRHLAELAQAKGFAVQESELPMSGRRRVLAGELRGASGLPPNGSTETVLPA